VNHLQSEYAVLADPKQEIGHGQRAILIKEFSNLICSRLDWLQGRDRILVEMVYDRGFSYRTVAELTGMRPSSICRRARTLIRRLLSREYQICLLRRNQLSFLQLCIARERFVLGMSRSDIALRHRISLYSVDQHLQHLANLTGKFAAAPAKNHTEPMKEGA
jgi:hypothetical protein